MDTQECFTEQEEINTTENLSENLMILTTGRFSEQIFIF